MKVKIIRTDTVWSLEEKINELLKDANDSQIIDIKYQGVGNHPAYSTDYPSAMLIVRDDYYEVIKYRF